MSDLIKSAKELNRIVEGIDGTMNHGTWRDQNGTRLKDTPEWASFYNAISSSEGMCLVPTEPTVAMMEAVNGDMAEQREHHIHIFAADVWGAMLSAHSERDNATPSREAFRVGWEAQTTEMDDEDRTQMPDGFDANIWRKADKIHHAMALVASDVECVKIVYSALSTPTK